ncbi:MAG: ribonuclease P protein component [Bryobacterales bacterium]|nr:ribonuclease P protein component [Bryobacterales bacterium]
MPVGAGSSPSATNGPCSAPSTSPKEAFTSNDSPAPRFPFGPERRIQKSKEYRLVYDTGRKVAKSNFVAFCLRRLDDGPTRVGFTTPRGLGKAVLRNRVRRRIREAIRVNLWRLPNGWSLVFNPRRVAAERSFPEIVAEVEQVLARCAASSS